jgi:solute carrier family 25 folate transporter 32
MLNLGMVPALFGVSHGAIQFMAYEEMKKWHQKYSGHDVIVSVLSDFTPTTLINLQKSTAEYIGMAASSKCFATIATYPYQVVRSRLQDNRQIAVRYLGVMDVIKRLFQMTGLRGFYRGLLPNVIRVLPGTCVTFAVYETLSKWMKQQAEMRRIVIDEPPIQIDSDG